MRPLKPIGLGFLIKPVSLIVGILVGLVLIGQLFTAIGPAGPAEALPVGQEAVGVLNLSTDVGSVQQTTTLVGLAGATTLSAITHNPITTAIGLVNAITANPTAHFDIGMQPMQAFLLAAIALACCCLLAVYLMRHNTGLRVYERIKKIPDALTRENVATAPTPARHEGLTLAPAPVPLL